MRKLAVALWICTLVVISGGVTTPLILAQEDILWNDVFTLRGSVDARMVFHVYAYLEYFDTAGAPLAGNATFRQHVFEPFFGYPVNDKVFVKGVIEFEDIGRSPSTVEKIQIEQAEIDITPWKNTTFALGAILVPFGLENYKHAPSDNPLVTRPRAFKDGGIVPNTWTDAGIQIIQTIPMIGSLDLYYINGDAKNGRTPRDDKDVGNNGKSAGVELQVTELVSGVNFGVSYVAGPWGTYFNTVSLSSSTVDANRWGGHLDYHGTIILPVLFTAEYVGGTNERDSSVMDTSGNKKDKDVAGYYITLGLSPLNDLTALVRLGAWDNDEEKPDNSKTEYTYGLRWKMAAGTYIKGEYRVTKNKPIDAKDNQVAIQVSATF